MTADLDFEPYVADPREPGPRPRLARRRPLVVGLIVALFALQAAYLAWDSIGAQDPALEAPIDPATPGEQAP